MCVVGEFRLPDADGEVCAGVNDFVLRHDAVTDVCIVNQHTVIGVAHCKKIVDALIVGLNGVAVRLGLVFLICAIASGTRLVGNTRVTQFTKGYTFDCRVDFGKVAIASVPSCAIFTDSLWTSRRVVVLVDVRVVRFTQDLTQILASRVVLRPLCRAVRIGPVGCNAEREERAGQLQVIRE